MNRTTDLDATLSCETTSKPQHFATIGLKRKVPKTSGIDIAADMHCPTENRLKCAM